MKLEIRLDDRDVDIIGIYQGFDEDINKKLRKIVKEEFVKGTAQKIILGDLNEIRDGRDYDGESGNHRVKGKMIKMLEEEGMVDIMRERNKTKKFYTCVRKTTAGLSYSRLDYIWVSQDMAEEIIEINVDNNCKYKTDHMPVYCRLTVIPKKVKIENLQKIPRTKDRSTVLWDE